MFRKIRTLILMILAAPIVFLVRAVKPIVTIRFGPLRSERIGHFAANTELYLCKRDIDTNGRKNLDIFYYTSSICNRQLKKMWDRTLRIFSFSRWIDCLNRKLPGGEKHIIPIVWDVDKHNLLGRTHPHLFFTAKEEKAGAEALQRLGMRKNATFVCFYARDSAYLDAAFPDRDWDYHDYRDSDIHNYIAAAEEIAQRGHYVVRMGAVAKDAMNTRNPRIIDYAKSHRSDFLDIFLSAKCRFFLGSTGGINAVPRIFRRPIAYVNFIPLGMEHFLTCIPGSLFIPKKLWSRERHRFLTFGEIIKLKISIFFTSKQYEKSGVDIIENTPEEIKALAKEMDERLKETWVTTEDDEELQRHFWMLFKSSDDLDVDVKLRIGAEFLRKNRELVN